MINTTIYDSEGNVLETSNEEVLSNYWRSGQNIAGYVEIGTCVTAIGNNALQNNNGLNKMKCGKFNIKFLFSKNYKIAFFFIRTSSFKNKKQ